MELNYTPYRFTSTDGYIQTTVPVCLRKTIDSYIKQSSEPAHSHLVGHIKKEFFLNGLEKDEMWVDLITSCCQVYLQEFPVFDDHIQFILNKSNINAPFKLDTPWVNKMKKYEFNPIHRHSGLFSYVMWLTIPFNLQEELNYFKNTKSNRASTFEFVYSTSIGVQQHSINVDKNYEGELIVFPASQLHCVYPFYTSNKERVSIAGNVNINI